MRAVCKTSAAIFEAAINRIPTGETSVTLDAGNQANGGAIMALHVENIGDCQYGPLYSFAHYYEQNGDMMRDPDVVMIACMNRATGALILYPISYRQDGLGIDREDVVFNPDGNGYTIRKRSQADLATFCGQWGRNLKQQQRLEPAAPRRRARIGGSVQED